MSSPIAEPSSSRRSRRPLVEGLLLVLVAAAPLLAQAAHELPDLEWKVSVPGDYAGLEHDVRRALHGDALVGSPSRLGVRNLGPTGMYWLAAVYGPTGQGTGGMVVAAWLAHLAGIAGVVLLVRAHLGRRAAWVTSIILSVGLVRAGPAMLSDFYNPGLTVPGVLVGTVALALVSLGRWSALPFAAAAVTWAVHLHFVAAPGLLPATVLALALGARRVRPPRRQVGLAALVVAVLWLPTIVDQVTDTGNLVDVVTAVRAGPGTAEQPLGDPGPAPTRGERLGMSVELASLTVPDAALVGTLYGTASGGPDLEGRRIALGGALLVAAITLAVLGRRRSPFGAHLIAIASVGATTTALVTALVGRGFFWYYLVSLPAYGLALAMGTGLLVLGARPQWFPLRRLPAAGLIVGTACFGITAVVTHDRVSEVVRTLTPASMREVVDEIEDAIPAGCPREVHLDSDVDGIGEVWLLLNELDARGIQGTVPGPLEVLAGLEHARTGTEAIEVAVPSGQQLVDGEVGSVTSPLRTTC